MANEQRRSALAFPTTASCSTEAALKSDKFLVIAHGTADEVAKAKIILETTSSEKIDHPFGDIGNLTGNFSSMDILARFAAAGRAECEANCKGGASLDDIQRICKAVADANVAFHANGKA